MPKLKHLYLQNFRNYKDACFEFVPGVNAIIGDNAQGKTNLLEAIYLLMTGRSFRAASMPDFPYFGTSTFYIEAHFEKSGVSQVLKMHFQEKERVILLNHTPLPTLSSLFGILPGSVLTPEDRALITGAPMVRRQFLNLHIAQTNPLYLYHFRRYEKALKHRNALLKQKNTHSIEVWEEEMAISGTYLMETRAKECEEIEQKANFFQNLLCAHERISLTYKSFLFKEPLLHQLAQSRKRELALGYSIVGPHKDDLLILLSQQGALPQEARLFASEGQKRGIITALRLAEWQILKEKTGENPLFCIDDLGIFLDKKREERLYTLLEEAEQVFLTSPRPIPKGVGSQHQIIVSSGSIKKEAAPFAQTAS